MRPCAKFQIKTLACGLLGLGTVKAINTLDDIFVRTIILFAWAIAFIAGAWIASDIHVRTHHNRQTQ